MTSNVRQSEAGRTVLIVDDDPQVLNLYKRFLSDEYTVRAYSDGRAALEEIDDTIDVILLDRRMPKLSGDEFLETIRELGYDCPVALVTAIEPAIDILELGFDEYIVKPVSRDELLEVVASLIRRISYERHINEWLALLSKKATLESVKTEDELRRNAKYRRLLEDIEQLAERTDAELSQISESQIDALFYGMDSEISETP